MTLLSACMRRLFIQWFVHPLVCLSIGLFVHSVDPGCNWQLCVRQKLKDKMDSIRLLREYINRVGLTTTYLPVVNSCTCTVKQ